MKLNCKQGDLAVIVNPIESVNAGVIVEVIRPAFAGDPMGNGKGSFQPSVPGPYWIIRSIGRPLLVRMIKTGAVLMTEETPCPDSRLRPLRDSDGEDEVLRLVGRPVGTPQAA